MPTFEIQDAGSQRLHEIFDHENEVTIGRGAANTIQLQDGGASKHHATIRRLQGHWKLVDLESRNGTAVNGGYRNQRWLTDGDKIQIGGAELVWSAQGGAQGPPATAPVAARPTAVAARVATPKAATPKAVTPPPAPAAPKRMVEEEIVPAAPAAPRPVASPPPAMTPPPAAAPAPAPTRGAAPSRRRRDAYDDGYDDGYDDYEERRPVRRKDNNAAMIVIIGIVCAVAFVALMFALGGGDAEQNQTVLAEAQRIRGDGNYQAALSYINENADPGGAFYAPVRDLKDQLERIIANEAQSKLNEQAETYWDRQIIRRAISPGFKAKDALPDDQVVERLHEFLAKFEGTRAARRLLKGSSRDEVYFRKLMREYATGDADPASVLSQVLPKVNSMARLKRYGEAIRKLETFASMQQLRLTRDRSQELRRLADDKLAKLRTESERDFETDMEAVERSVTTGDRATARRKLDEMIGTYGIEKLVAQAKSRLAEL